MSLVWLADRAGAGAFMLAAGTLLVWRMPARRARIAWIALIVLSGAYDLALNLQPVNFPNSNFDHHYLGAKSPAPYMDTWGGARKRSPCWCGRASWRPRSERSRMRSNNSEPVESPHAAARLPLGRRDLSECQMRQTSP